MTIGEKKMTTELRRNPWTELARAVPERWRELGLPFPRGNRLEAMTAATRGGGLIEADDPRFPQAVQAVQDLQEAAFIIDVLGRDLDRNQRRKRLGVMLQDEMHPKYVAEPTGGRDRQAELFTEAILERAACAPSFVDPPDFQITVPGIDQPVWVEVKRAKSRRAMYRAAKDAFDVLGKKPGLGVAVIQVARVHDRQSVLVDGLSQAEFNAIWNVVLDRQIGRHRDHLIELRAGRAVRGVLVLQSWVRHVGNGQWSLESVYYWLPLDPRNTRRTRELMLIQSAFNHGIPGGAEPLQPSRL